MSSGTGRPGDGGLRRRGRAGRRGAPRPVALAVVLLPLGLLSACGDGPAPVEITSGSNAAVCPAVTAATKKLEAQLEQPPEMRQAAAEIRDAVAGADDPLLRRAANEFADRTIAWAAAVESEDQAAIALTRGDVQRAAPPIGDECGVAYDQVLSF